MSTLLCREYFSHKIVVGIGPYRTAARSAVELTGIATVAVNGWRENFVVSIVSALRQLTMDYADRPAVLMGGSILTYSGLWDAVARVTSLLSASGLAPRDRVAIMLPDIPAFPIACYGTLCAGGVVVPMSPQLKSREIAYHLADSGARVI